MIRISDLPESLFLSHVFVHLNAVEVQRVRWVLSGHSTMQWMVPVDWAYVVTLDTRYLSPGSRDALRAYYRRQYGATMQLSFIERIYGSDALFDLPSHRGGKQLTVHDIGFYPSTFLSRGLCWSNSRSIHWFDTLSNTTRVREFDWLTFPPWDLSAIACVIVSSAV